MDTSSRWLLLQISTNILQEATRSLVGDSEYAKAAQRKTRSQDKSAVDAFHSTMYSRLSALASLLNEGHHDLDLTSDSLTDELTSLLDTFEILVNETFGSANEETGTDSYPGLNYLQELREKDRYETKDPKPPGFRRCLYCPSKANRDRLRRRTSSCLSALENMQRRPPDLPSILDKIDSRKEFSLPSSISRDAERTSNVLRQYWGCDCVPNGGCAKQAVVAFTGSRRHERHVASRYCLNFKAESRSRNSWSAANLALIDVVEQSTSNSEHRRRPKGKSKAVSFIVPELSTDSAPASARWITYRNFCHIFNPAVSVEHIYASERELKSMATETPSAVPSISMLSLNDVLIGSTPGLKSTLGPKDRVVLGVILTYTYLHLNGTSWWPTNEIEPNCWFTIPKQSISFHPRMAFFALRKPISTSEEDTQDAPPMEVCMNYQRPSLPALGKLLLEVWKGARISWNEVQSCLKECVQDATGAYWSCAIKACLSDPALKREGSLRVTGELRSVFVLKVVKSLQWLLEEICDISVKDAFSEVLAGSAIATASYVPKVSHSSSSRRTTDDLRQHETGDTEAMQDKPEPDAVHAWFQRIDQEVRSFVVQYPNAITAGAKIAIIDTGVALDRRTAFMYEDQIQECRSWLGDLPTDEGEPQSITIPDGDTDGHGTHLLSTLTRVDPFCKVYIARVFRGRHDSHGTKMQDSVEQRVVKAIRYAIDKWQVNIISLSFGFKEHVEAIDTELIKAQQSKVLVFAAASNRGGSNETSWPARHPSVIGVYATDAYGNKYPRNPSPRLNKDNFAALGVDVEGWWSSGTRKVQSGTSVSTPVLAGIATLIIAFMQSVKPQYLALGRGDESSYDQCLKRLCTLSAMRDVLHLMASKKEGYDYVEPWKLLSASQGDATSIADRILSVIRAA